MPIPSPTINPHPSPCPSQGDPFGQVALPDHGDDCVRWHGDGGGLPGARAGRHHPELDQEGRRRALPQVPDGNQVQFMNEVEFEGMRELEFNGLPDY